MNGQLPPPVFGNRFGSQFKAALRPSWFARLEPELE